MPFGNDRLVVAVAQLACRDDPAEILADHLASIDAARRDGVDLLLFPELSLTGYAAGLTAASRNALPTHEAVARLATASGSMAVSVGLPEEGATGVVYNTQLLLRDGAVLHRHRKINLPTYGKLEEGKHFAAGGSVEPLQIGAWRIATLICADTWNPALPWLAALAGANLLLVPIASATDAVGHGFDQDSGWTTNARHTALTYGVPFLMANHTGGGFWGGSRILDATGEPVVRTDASPGLLRAELSLDTIRAARRRLPTIRDAMPAVIASELARLAG